MLMALTQRNQNPAARKLFADAFSRSDENGLNADFCSSKQHKHGLHRDTQGTEKQGSFRAAARETMSVCVVS